MFFGGAFRHKFGNSGLVACGGEGEGKRQYRIQKLVDTHAFFSKQAGEVNAVEKADDPADKSGYCEDDRTHDQWVSLISFHKSPKR